MKEIKNILKRYGLKLTLPRLKLLEIFLSNNKAVTHGELLKLTEKTFDRVTVYRTLKSFEDLGIIHRIIGANDSPNYALSAMPKMGSNELNKKPHLHFSCVKCNGVFCLNDQFVPQINLPGTYEVHSLNLVVKGICKECLNSCKD